MSRFINNHKPLIALALAIALVAVVVPMCRMVGCSMEGGSMGMMHVDSTLGFSGDCGGEYTSTSGPSGIVPSGLQSLMLSLVAAVAAAGVLFVPQRITHSVFAVDAEPPPPPEEPRGQRFRV